MRLIVRTVLILLSLGAVAGCHSPAYLRKHAHVESCNDRAPYLTAQTAAPLRTPEGLAPPNTKNALKIGETAAARTRATSEGCLDKAPNFFANQAKTPVPVAPAAPATPAAPPTPPNP